MKFPGIGLLEGGRRGYCTMCHWHKVRDADTIEVRLPMTGKVIAIRLDGIDAPELTTAAGRRAKKFVDSLLELNDEPLYVWLEPPKDLDKDGRIDIDEILKTASFDRWPGHLFVGSEDINDVLLRHGHAKEWTR